MARRSVASGDSQFRPASARPRPGIRGLEISPTLERRWFDFDRAIVTRMLSKLQHSIHDGASQIGMIADEQMFDPVLSRTFARTARRLNKVIENLKRLNVEVNRANGYPKPARSPLRDSIIR
ncbi:MAG TPA: hypothetical protein VKR29_11525 [Candidatus Binataceae bacterium]|nr:hypothetical protein [Candidatus Binataceae bacterium]